MTRPAAVNSLVSFTSLLIVAGCSSSDRTTAPFARPEFAISDAVHEGGTPGFFFLPPMVAQPTFSGTFDADITTLNPAIAVCDVTNGPDAHCGGTGGTPAIVVFTTTSTPAITVDLSTPQYQVNWDTKAAGFVAGSTYRLHVMAGASGARRELGFADVLLTTTPGQVKHVATGDLVVLKDGRTVAVDFRIETGIPGDLAVTAASASVVTGRSDLITATVQDLRGAPLPGAAVAWTVTTTPVTGVADPTAPLTPTSAQTDVGGTTATTFKAGSSAGTALVSAASAGIKAAATVTVVPATVFSQVSAGDAHACAVTTGGAVYCWGSGPLGDGTGNSSPSPVLVQGGLTFTQVSAGAGHTCGVTIGGSVYCWGLNSVGQLGDGTASNLGTSPEGRLSPVLVQGGLTFAQVSAGGGFSCGVTTSGAAYCWGFNAFGQVGDGTSESEGTSSSIRPSPALVQGGHTFTHVSAGGSHACAVATDGAAYCWGQNVFKVPCCGDTQSSPFPVGAFAQVSAGLLYTCALTTGEVAYCWGYNSSGSGGGGQLGDGNFNEIVTTPVPVVGGLAFTQVSASPFSSGSQNTFHTCGVASGGSAYCWGQNVYGEVGDGSVGTIRASPVLVLGGLTFAQVSAGGGFSCGVTTSGAAYCWGWGGKLGDGTSLNRTSPVPVVQ